MLVVPIAKHTSNFTHKAFVDKESLRLGICQRQLNTDPLSAGGFQGNVWSHPAGKRQRARSFSGFGRATTWLANESLRPNLDIVALPNAANPKCGQRFWEVFVLVH